jgi:hypothetical protein
MNDQEHDGPLDALFAQARTHRPDTSKAEYAFETRLLARLRAKRETNSVWAMVSWRLVPFFAVGVLALTLWQAEAATETNDAATIAGLTNPVASDLWSN